MSLMRALRSWDIAAVLCAGTIVCVVMATLMQFSSGLDTCGTYFFLPTFPACNLFLEVVPCFNLTPSILVAMATVQGREIYNFTVTFGGVKEITLQDLNADKHEGLMMRSQASVSLYVHQTLGDSMQVFPVDTYAKAYEIPRLTRATSETGSDNFGDISGSSGSSSNSGSSSVSGTETSTDSDSSLTSAELKSNKTRTLLQTHLHAALYIFSPKTTNITISSSFNDSFSSSDASQMPSTSLSSATTTSSSSGPSLSSSSVSFSSHFSSTQHVIKLEAFTIFKFSLNNSLLYRLYSDEQFAMVLVQSNQSLSRDYELCYNATLKLLDFVPPFATAGKTFYIAFFHSLPLALYFSGQENTSIEVVTDTETQQLRLDQSGSSFHHVTSTTAVWMSASLPVIIYTRLVICNESTSSVTHNSSAYESDSTISPSPTFLLTSSSSPSTTSSTTLSSAPVCAESGFFLSGVENFFTCDGNSSIASITSGTSTSPTCHCRCPSVFQRDFDPLNFLAGQSVNLTSSNSQSNGRFTTWTRPSASSGYPFLVGEFFDINTAIAQAVDFNGAYDIVVNTNSSFLVFRQDFVNLNFLPAGMSLNEPACVSSKSIKGQSVFMNAACSDYTTASTPTPTQQADTTICQCELIQDLSALFYSEDSSRGHITNYNSGQNPSVILNSRDPLGNNIFSWEEDKEDTTRPLIAVVVSLCVAIFAVVALISGYMLAEMVSRRKHVRNTKIRPFVS